MLLSLTTFAPSRTRFARFGKGRQAVFSRQKSLLLPMMLLFFAGLMFVGAASPHASALPGVYAKSSTAGIDPTSSITLKISPTTVIAGETVTWLSVAMCTDTPAMCTLAHSGSGAAVPDGYVEHLAVQLGSSCTFTGQTVVQSVVTSKGMAGGTITAPNTPGQYCVRVEHPSQRIGLLFVWSAAASSPVVVTVLAKTTLMSGVNPRSITLGGSAQDQVLLMGGTSPTGTITYTVHSSPACSDAGTVVGTSTVTGDGPYSSPSFFPASPGTYYWVAAYSGDSKNGASTNTCGTTGPASEVLTTSPAHTSLSSLLSSSGTISIGGSATDSATLSGGVSPTGTIAFEVFDSSHPLCVGSPLFVSTKPVGGNGVYASDAFQPFALGTYFWTAEYSGDANNSPSSTACQAPPETLSVVKASPMLSTTVDPSSITLPPTPPSGSPTTPPASDAATLSEGYSPFGTITFNVFTAPDCSGTSIFSSSAPVSGDGTYLSGSFVAPGPGTYYWKVSFTATDGNDNSIAPACGGHGETLIVSPASPITTTSVTPGTIALSSFTADTTIPPASDAATVSGGYSPAGTITFAVFTAQDCSGTPLFTGSLPVSGNGVYSSGLFVPPSAGTYYWQVSTTLTDANDNPILTSCGGTGEVLTVTPASPSLSTVVKDSSGAAVTSSPLGTNTRDTSSISGGFDATGTVTYTLFAGGACAGTPAATETDALSSGQASDSAAQTLGAGSYSYQAQYSGDINNLGAGGSCESFTINQASTTTTTDAKDGSGTSVTGGSDPLGSSVHDTAQVGTQVGSFVISGAVTYHYFTNGGCTGTPEDATATLAGGSAPDSSAQGPLAAGSYSFKVDYSGDSNYIASTSGCESFTILMAPTSTATSVRDSSGNDLTGASVVVGVIVHDASIVSGQVGTFTISGTVTYNLFPNNGCAGTPSNTQTVPVGTGASPLTPNAGAYSFSASYSGDSNYIASYGPCEPFTILKASPTVTTSLSQTSETLTTTATAVTDSGTVAGGYGPTGTITFQVYSDNACTTLVNAVSPAASVSGNGVYSSGPFTPAGAGIYYWTATYGGDNNNNGFATGCGISSETLTVSPASPTGSTQLSQTSETLTTAATSVTDAFTLGGGFYPSGTLTFGAYGNSACSGTPTFTGSNVVAGNGQYASGSFTPAGAGTYTWQVSYTGDANNNAFTSCGGSSETLVVNKASPSLTTRAAAGPITPGTIALGSAAVDTATISGGFSTGGSLGFSVYFNDNACKAGSLVYTSPSVAVSGNGVYTSGSFTPTKAGNYYWTAAYSGDSNNNGVPASCGAAGETMVVAFSNAPPSFQLSSNAGDNGGVSPGQSVHLTAQVQGGTANCVYGVTMTVSGPAGNAGPWSKTTSFTSDNGGNGQVQLTFPSGFSGGNDNTVGAYLVSASFSCGSSTGSAGTGFTVNSSNAKYQVSTSGGGGDGDSDNGVNVGQAVQLTAQVQQGKSSCSYGVTITVTGPSANPGPWTATTTLTTNTNGNGQAQVSFPSGFSAGNTNSPGGYLVSASFSCGSSTGSAGTGFTVSAPSFKASSNSDGNVSKSGTLSINARVSDGVASATYTVTITITGPSPSTTKTYSTTATITTDSGGDGSVTVSGIPAGSTSGTFTITAVFTPTSGLSGMASSTFIVS